MAKICFQMIAFNSAYVLPQALKSIIPYGKVVVTEGPVSYWIDRGYTTSTDGTNEILKELVGEENIVHGRFKEKDEMVNASVHLVPDDTTHIWAVDADEVYRSEDIEDILSSLDKFDSVSFMPHSFYGGFDRTMTGFEENYEIHRIQRWYPGAKWATHRPPTINAHDGRPWREHKHFSSAMTDYAGIRMYHYSYVFPKQMKDKADYYAAIGGSNRIPDYFNKVYLPWVLGDDKAKQEIEDKYNGVHDYIPEVRGECRTAPYLYSHPKEIEDTLDVLQEDFNRQLDEVARA